MRASGTEAPGGPAPPADATGTTGAVPTGTAATAATAAAASPIVGGDLTPLVQATQAITDVLTGIYTEQQGAATRNQERLNQARTCISLTPFAGDINPESESGRKLYEIAIAPLGTAFDGKKEQLRSFLQSMKNKVCTCKI